MADEQGREDRDLLWFERDAPARVAEDGPDPLGQRLAWRTLKAALAGYEPPACVALYGPWGSGKTTLLRSAFEAFEGPKVWFDPWQSAQTGDVRVALLGAIAQGLGLKKDSKGWEAVKSIGKALGSFAFRAGLGAVFGRQLLPELENAGAAGFKVEDAAAYFPGKAVVDAVQAVKTGFKALVDEALEDAALEGKGPTVVEEKGPTPRVLICLDDLDRCLPADVVALIEAVKLLLVGDEGCRAVFAFALDRQIVGEAIRQQYPGASRYTGENYLEKVFDLSLEVPPVRGSEALTEHLSAAVARVPLLNQMDAEGNPVPLVFGDPTELSRALASPALGNPRVLKRALNRLVLLQANPAVHKRLMLLADVDAEVRVRLLAWLAATERFRDFRHFLRRATEDEIKTLDHGVVRLRNPDRSGAPPLTGEMTGFLDTPGFVELYNLVFQPLGIVAERAVNWTELSKVTQAGQIMTVGSFDALMRAAGL